MLSATEVEAIHTHIFSFLCRSNSTLFAANFYNIDSEFNMIRFAIFHERSLYGERKIASKLVYITLVWKGNEMSFESNANDEKNRTTENIHIDFVKWEKKPYFIRNEAFNARTNITIHHWNEKKEEKYKKSGKYGSHWKTIKQIDVFLVRKLKTKEKNTKTKTEQIVQTTRHGIWSCSKWRNRNTRNIQVHYIM